MKSFDGTLGEECICKNWFESFAQAEGIIAPSTKRAQRG